MLLHPRWWNLVRDEAACLTNLAVGIEIAYGANELSYRGRVRRKALRRVDVQVRQGMPVKQL